MDTNNLAHLIDAKLKVLVQLLALARRQAAYIGENDIASLLKILAGKQQLVNELQMLDRELAPYQRQSPELRRWESVDERHRCRQQAARCEALLREMLQVEGQAEDALVVARAASAQRLAAVNQISHAERAYVQTPLVSASRLDLTSEG